MRMQHFKMGRNVAKSNQTLCGIDNIEKMKMYEFMFFVLKNNNLIYLLYLQQAGYIVLRTKNRINKGQLTIDELRVLSCAISQFSPIYLVYRFLSWPLVKPVSINRIMTKTIS